MNECFLNKYRLMVICKLNIKDNNLCIFIRYYYLLHCFSNLIVYVIVQTKVFNNDQIIHLIIILNI